MINNNALFVNFYNTELGNSHTAGFSYGAIWDTAGFHCDSLTELWVIVHWITMKTCHIPYENACPAGVCKVVRQGRAEPAKYVFRANSTPPPHGAGWIAQTCLGEPMGQWGAGWKEYVTWTMYPAKLMSTEAQISLLADSACVWLSKDTVWNGCTRYVHHFVQCSVSPLWCTQSSCLIICFSKFSQL